VTPAGSPDAASPSESSDESGGGSRLSRDEQDAGPAQKTGPREAVKHDPKVTDFRQLALHGDLSELQKAIQNNPEGIDAAEKHGRNALMEAVINNRPDLVAALLAGGADPRRQDNNGRSPLFFAAQDGHLAIARQLLDGGADVQVRDSYGNTPLSNAVFHCDGKNGEMIALLLSHGADPYAENTHGVSPLKLAQTISNHDVLQFLPH